MLRLSSDFKTVSYVIFPQTHFVCTWAYFQLFICGDNRDIAETHIKAAITPGANGRYIVSNPEHLSNKETNDCLKERFPGITLAVNDNSPVRTPLKVSPKLTEELLGRKLRTHCETWGDAIQGFWDAGLTTNPGLHKEL